MAVIERWPSYTLLLTYISVADYVFLGRYIAAAIVASYPAQHVRTRIRAKSRHQSLMISSSDSHRQSVILLVLSLNELGNKVCAHAHCVNAVRG